MDTRAETSGRFGGQWAFLSTPQDNRQPRSLPPSSSCLRSDQSSVSPRLANLAFNQANVSRSSLSRNGSPSIGAQTTTTNPSQPILLRIHSRDASAHQDPAPRIRKRREEVKDRKGLPAVSEFSISAILAAIEEDVEDDINAISEILGRSRFVLADQHESHLPPQGEIRAANDLAQRLQDTNWSDERIAEEEPLIVNDEGSLVDGSCTGSDAYRLLESLRVAPRTRRTRGGRSRPRLTAASRSDPTPTISDSTDASIIRSQPWRGQATSSRLLLSDLSNHRGTQASLRTTPFTSESHLFAGAGLSDPSVTTSHLRSANDGLNQSAQSLPHNQHPCDRTAPSSNNLSDRNRPPNRGLPEWIIGAQDGGRPPPPSAESQLRGILHRQRAMSHDDL